MKPARHLKYVSLNMIKQNKSLIYSSAVQPLHRHSAFIILRQGNNVALQPNVQPPDGCGCVSTSVSRDSCQIPQFAFDSKQGKQVSERVFLKNNGAQEIKLLFSYTEVSGKDLCGSFSQSIERVEVAKVCLNLLQSFTH